MTFGQCDAALRKKGFWAISAQVCCHARGRETHCYPNHHPRLGLVGVNEQGEVVIMNMQVGSKIARSRYLVFLSVVSTSLPLARTDRADEIAEPPDNLRTLPRIRSNDQYGLCQDEAFP